MGANLPVSLKVLDYYDFTDKSIVLCRKLSRHTRNMYLTHDKIFCRQLKNRRKFAIYNFDEKVKTLLVNNKFQLLKFFEIDTYLDRRSFVMNFYNFLNDLRNGVYEELSLEDLKIYQMHVAKTKDYHDQVIEIVQDIANIDKISFDLLRLSRIREDYCITNEVAQEHEQILKFFLSISDDIPEYIKYFQIKGVKSLQATFEFLETCPIQIEILDIVDIEPNTDISGYELSSTLLKSLEKVTMSYNSPKNLEEYPELCGQFIKEQFKFFTEFLTILCKEESHQVIFELKINREVDYHRPVNLTFKNCFFTVFDSVQETLNRYFSKQIEVCIDGAHHDEDFNIDLEDEKVNIFSPKFLSVTKPRFVKSLTPDVKSPRSFISCSFRDVSSVDVTSKKDIKSLQRVSNEYIGDAIDEDKFKNLHSIYSKCMNKISLTKCVMSEFRGPEFNFYLNNNVQIIELVITDCNFERFTKYLSTVKFKNKIRELSISIGNSSYLKPFLYLLMGKKKETEIHTSNSSSESIEEASIHKDFCVISENGSEVLHDGENYTAVASECSRTRDNSYSPYPYLEKLHLHHMHDTRGQRDLIFSFIKRMKRLQEFRTGDYKWKKEYVYEFNFSI